MAVAVAQLHVLKLDDFPASSDCPHRIDDDLFLVAHFEFFARLAQEPVLLEIRQGVGHRMIQPIQRLRAGQLLAKILKLFLLGLGPWAAACPCPKAARTRATAAWSIR